MKSIELANRVLRRVPKGRNFYFSFIRYIPVNKEKIIKELDGNFFLITSTGRTGTTLFANILNSSGESQVAHEPMIGEQYYHRLSIENPNYSYNYISNFRLKEIYLRKTKKRYGEVNSALRRNVKDIKRILPKTTVIQIIRNGYDVVSSILNRKTFTKNDRYYWTMIPDASIIPEREWSKLSRFEKICFMWAEENRWLSENCDVSAKFETLIEDYEYFTETVANVVGISVSKESWEYYVNKNINPNSSYYDENKPENWTKEQHDSFNRICGSEMARYGY